jgi:hypothetical protein
METAARYHRDPSGYGALVAGSVYGSGTGTQQNNGQVIRVLSAGDVVTIVNHSSASAVT